MMGLALLLLWYWQKGRGDVTLKQTCVFPDGVDVLVPLGSACPYDAAHGGQSIIRTDGIPAKRCFYPTGDSIDVPEAQACPYVAEWGGGSIYTEPVP